MSELFDSTDAVLARKLAGIAPPADLRARLLALDVPAEEVRPVAWWGQGITALAAALALMFVVLGLLPRGGESMNAATAELSTFLSTKFELQVATPDVNVVRGWLKRQNPGQRIDLPTRLAQNPTIGCRELMWRNHRGSLACFSLGGGREAHLAMFPAATFTDAPGRAPRVAAAGKWTRVAWSRNGMTYLLFVPAGMNPMKELAGGPAVQRAGRSVASNANSVAWGRVKSASERASMASPV